MTKLRLQIVVATAMFAIGSGLYVGAHSGRVYGGEYQPISIDSASSVVAGQSLSIGVGVQGPSSIQIYSDPLGAVSYTGTVDGTTSTVSAATDPNASGPVTVYLATDGETTVSESVYVQDGADN